ncbi:hypothetical protein GF339_01005 [candidate division KSB3 bacterium]|uniref:Uncharacterized protein n=1 Tax=candidate division KSB3 bacterium TaxID=2044937 RepID=A0A9D5Q4C9_9BACT|nr:hypothetical protein [candidate division KSB3 bacterium]
MRNARLPHAVLLLMMLLSMVVEGKAEDGTAQPLEDRTQQIEQLAEEADAYFQQQEFLASYELYRSILLLDPTHELAQERIYEIADIYKTLAEMAKQDQNPEQSDILYHHYRDIVRDMLGLMTTRLKETLKIYNKLKLDATTEDQERIVVLADIIDILRDLKTLYEDFPRENAETAQIVKKISATITKYEEELARYQP